MPDKIQNVTHRERPPVNAVHRPMIHICHRCGRQLTDPVSRSIGIGPGCLRALPPETLRRLADVLQDAAFVLDTRRAA
ncbi:DUF6011 domain-containing protein [Frankia sp. Cas3]|uniref:DUF6011 domain-containing protein n=1 Tax=Frankia sp. Cas3 TaxID=3073926 RepID=UPI002AD2599B|nr:DUF6011 domain-containing protein [Frankia sp. Cas3]